MFSTYFQIITLFGMACVICRCLCACSYLGWDSVKVLPQHPPHVFACVRGHLVLEQEGELATLADAVEVAVDLVILTTCERRNQ